MNLLLLLCGDIHLNPDPACFPCTICNRPCSELNQCGIQCDGCQNWTCASCADIIENFYAQLESKLELSRFYPSRLYLELPTVSNDSEDELL